ncbi:MAG: hypothetical protein J6S58_05310 [Lentisphaeria bacterium]|nr:hypothetical protein [Lentisphaeria bacterium]
MRKFFLLCLNIFLLPALYAVPLMQEKITVDGLLSEGVWQKLPWKSSFTLLGTSRQAQAQTRFKTFNDGKNIFFGVECDEPLIAQVRKNDYSENSPLLWMNDSVELNLVPDGKLVSFYKIIVDAWGRTLDLLGQDDNTDRARYLFNALWRSSAKSAVRFHKNKWCVEVSIPLGSMDYASAMTDQWRLNVGRNRWAVKGGELSSWSELPRRSHVVPKAFRTVKITSFKAAERLVDLEDLKGNVFRQNGRQFYKVSATVHNNTASVRIFHQNCTLTDVKTLKSYKASSVIELERNSYKEFTLTVPDVPNGEYILLWDLHAYRKEKPLFNRMVQKVTLSYIPMEITLKRPAYRDNIYATMKDKTIEALILMQEGKGSALTATLTGPDQKVVAVRKIATSTGKDRVIFDGSRLPDGNYTLTVQCRQNGRELRTSKRIRVLPYRKGEFFLDEKGIPHVDGKKFLSYGWYANYPRETAPHYNTYLNIAKFSRIQSAVNSVRNAFINQKQRSLVIPFQDLSGRNDWKQFIFKDPDTRKKGLTPEQKKKIIEFVSVISKEEGLLGYYMADEPECRDNNPAWYEEARDLIAEIDPYHPTFMLNYGPEGIRKYYKGCDILLPDCYPQYFEDGSTSRPRWAPSDYAKLTTSLRQAAFQMPQASCWPTWSQDKKLRGIAPTFDDFRSQVFQPVIHNVKGINLYAYFDSQRFSSMIITPGEVGRILHNAKEYLLENSLPNGVNVTTVPHFAHFQAGLKRHDGKYCLIAVNTSGEKLSVTFRIRSAFSGKFYPEGAKQTISVKNGLFTDTFLPNETKLYFSDKALAASLEVPAVTRQKVEDLRAARKVKGNLVGLGDMFCAEYDLYGQHKKYAPGIPVITASSDSTFYATRRHGSLYYLVDGLKDPNRGEYSWKPSSRDKNPFVQFKLAKKSPVKEVRLYTPCGNLQSGKVVVNGKEYPFVNNGKKNMISVLLKDKPVTDTVRIYCSKFSYPANRPDIDRRLLTEVEIF